MGSLVKLEENIYVSKFCYFQYTHVLMSNTIFDTPSYESFNEISLCKRLLDQEI